MSVMTATKPKEADFSKKGEQVNTLMEAPLKNALEALAKKDRRSLSSLVRIILADYVKDRIRAGVKFPRELKEEIEFIKENL